MMKSPIKKSLAYCMVLMFLFTGIPGNALASAGNPVSSGSAVEEMENPADISDGTETGNPTVVPAEDGIDETQSDSEDGLSQQVVSTQGIVHDYINLRRFKGAYDVVGAAADASSSSDFPSIAAYKDGQIICSDSGIANVSVQMTNGDTKIFHVSVYWEYPQPKTAKIKSGRSNVILQKFAKKDDTASTGDVLNGGDTVQVLYSASDQTSGASGSTGGVMQYVKSGNKEGWIFSQENDHRSMDTYFHDAAVSKDIWISTTLSNIPQTGNTWTHTGSLISISSNTYDGYANQCKITAGNRAGTAMVTGTDGYHKTTAFITIYTAVSSIAGRINKDAVEYNSADEIYPRSMRSQGASITISGQSGDFWRIGNNRYVLKSDVDILVTGVSLDKAYADTTVNNTIQLNAIVSPSNATDKTVFWSSNNLSISNVDGSGLVSGVVEGVSAIVATTNDGNKTATAKATVYTTIANVKGQTSRATSTWHSADGTNPAGNLSSGTEITISGRSGDYWRIGKDHYIAVKEVSIPISSVTLEKEKTSIVMGKSEKLKIKSLKPSIATNKMLKWTSSSKKVATVKADGTVNGHKTGTTTITVTAESGKTAICKVTVVEASIPNVKFALPASDFSNFTYVEYFYSFGNSDDDFVEVKSNDENKKTSRKIRESSKYAMTSKDLTELSKKLWEKHKNYYTKKKKIKGLATLEKDLKRRADEKWEGSCWGMVSTMILNRAYKIKVRKHSGYASASADMGINHEGYALWDVPKPAKSSNAKSIINYYHISQEEILKDLKKFGPNHSKGRNPLSEGYKKMVNYGKDKERMLLLGFHTKKIDHAILVLDYNAEASKKYPDYFYFNTYDPSQPYKETYIRIAKDYSTLDFGKKKGQKHYGKITFFSFLVNLDRFDYQNIDY